jgi:hypothetical protein
VQGNSQKFYSMFINFLEPCSIMEAPVNVRLVVPAFIAMATRLKVGHMHKRTGPQTGSLCEAMVEPRILLNVP